MEWSIPYQTGFHLGRIVELKNLTMRDTLICMEEPPMDPVVHMSDSRYAVVFNLKDVCDILTIPLDYALKVKVKEIQNELVSACLDALHMNTLSTIFRVSYVQQKQYFPMDTILQIPIESKTYELHSSTEFLASESFGKSIKDLGTHWISALDIGNELFVIMTLTAKDDSKRQKCFDKMLHILKNKTGLIDEEKLKALLKAAKKIDEKVKKFQLQLTIKYFSFDDLPTYPASMCGMLRSLETFTDQCTGWSQRRNDIFKVDTERRITFHLGDYEDRNLVNPSVATFSLAGLRDRASDLFKGKKDKTIVTQHSRDGIISGEENISRDNFFDEDENSIEVLKLNDTFYTLRATLTLINGETDFLKIDNDSFTALNNYRENTFFKYETIFQLLQSSEEIMHKLQQIMHSIRSEQQIEEAERTLKAVQSLRETLQDMVRELNYITVPSDDKINVLFENNELERAKICIENTTTKLPPGKNLNLLLIGTTGHGKSATGNSILGQVTFKSSNSATSETTEVSVGYAEIDGRTLKVVDTPGLWDTRLTQNAQLIDKAIESFSDAIAQCSEGFHALLVIFKFGKRMTLEEQQSIKLLKSILGEDIIRKHSVCLFTHGDNFEGSRSFMDWCRAQKGFMKGILEECSYRCLLFDNKTDDFHQRKSQMIELVTMIDLIQSRNEPYTNHLFTLAWEERNRIIEEAGLPQLKEDIIQDIQIFFSRLTTLVSEADHDRNLNELNDLKEKVENLKDKTKSNEKLINLFKIADSMSVDIEKIIHKKELMSPNLSPNLMENLPNLSTDLAEMRKCSDEIIEKNSEVNKMVSDKVQEQIKKDGISCFPGSSTICLESGASITLNALQVGDRVLTRDPNGQLVFDEVYMFGHIDFRALTEFVVIETISKKISLTAGHYIYCERNGQELCLAAENVKIGDTVFVVDGGNFVSSPVIGIGLDRLQGLYAPFTNNGNIVVDGILASCYINILRPRVCHSLLWPVRIIYKICPKVLDYINGSPYVDPVPKWVMFIANCICIRKYVMTTKSMQSF